MPRRIVGWLVIAAVGIAVFAPPLPGLCQENRSCSTSQVAPKGEVMQKKAGVRNALAASSAPGLNPGGRPPLAYAFAKESEEGLAVAVGLKKEGETYHNLGLELSDAAILCKEIIQVALGFAKMPGNSNQGYMSVFAVCDGTLRGAYGNYNNDTNYVSWTAATLEDAENINSVSTAVRVVNDTLHRSVCATNGESVYCWDMGAPRPCGTLPRTEYKIPSDKKFRTVISYAYDSKGRMHMVGVAEDGSLGYVRFPAESNEAELVEWLGDPAQEWGWPAVETGSGDSVWVSAYSSLDGHLHVWISDSSSSEWQSSSIECPEDARAGMYNSMAMDDDEDRGIAALTYAESTGHAVTVTAIPTMEFNPQLQDAIFGEPYSTATTAGGGYQDHLWISESGLWHQACQ